jgi:hypothetical protein
MALQVENAIGMDTIVIGLDLILFGSPPSRGDVSTPSAGDSELDASYLMDTVAAAP